MSGLILCTKQAINPLYVENGTIKLYNLEELCYYLYNYTYMITIDFFDENFIDFCENEIGQPALAQKVKECLAHKEPLKTIVMRVLESSYYYSSDEIKRFETTLTYLDSSSVMERFKVRADMMAKAGKWKAALKIYNDILTNKDEVMSLQFYSRVKSNIGVIYTNLFMYGRAAEYFEQAYESEPCEEYRDYLMCALMMLEDNEKFSRVCNKYNFPMELVDEYERAFENAKKAVRSDDKYNVFIEQFKYKAKKNLSVHYEKIEDALAGWKEEYRKAMDC